METVNPILAHALDLLKQNKTEPAQQEFARAAAAACSTLGENDIVTARTLAHLARVCTSRGKVDEAMSIYERILRIHEALPMPSNSDHAVTLLELAFLRENAGGEVELLLRSKADRIMAEVNASMQALGQGTESSDEDEDSEDASGESSDGTEGVTLA